MFIKDYFRNRKAKLYRNIDIVESDRSGACEKNLARQQIIDQFDDLVNVIDMYDSQLCAIEQSISKSRQILLIATCGKEE